MIELVFKKHPFYRYKFGLFRWFFKDKKYSISLEPKLFYYKKEFEEVYITILGIYYHSRYGIKH